jgi:L-alanine-DL-glutamate epimerase-like enolase superfamily enzyme
VEGYVAEGFTAFKLGTGYLGQPYGTLPFDAAVRQEEEKFAALRQAVGPGIDILIDGHQGAVTRTWPRKTALQVAKAMEPSILLFEEPLPRTIEPVRCCGGIDTPIATASLLGR